MNRSLTEKNILKKLGVEDIRHLTKNEVITMASMLDKMDPEVEKKALEQFPEFTVITKAMLMDYKKLDKGLVSNTESVQAYYDSCSSIIISLQKQLEDEILSFIERRYIIDRMLEVSRMMGEKDSENKTFIANRAVIGAVAACVATAVLASAIGGNTHIETNGNKLT